MFLAEKYIVRNCRKAWKEGFAEGWKEGFAEGRKEGFEEGQAVLQARWEAWLKRLEAAEAAGVEFTEPPPSRNRPGKPARTNGNKQTASAF